MISRLANNWAHASIAITFIGFYFPNQAFKTLCPYVHPSASSVANLGVTQKLTTEVPLEDWLRGQALD